MRLTGIEAVFARINRLQERLDDTATPEQQAAAIMQLSTRRKINQGGVPTVPLAAATITGRQRRGNTSTRPLIDTGAMRDSITAIFAGDRAEVGTDAVQSAALNFGYKQIPARPFTFFEPNDMDQIGQVFARHYMS
jgi:phage gpG-like protein